MCDSTAPTRVWFKRSKRSARKPWQPPGLKTDPSRPTVGFIGVENHEPNTYPDSCHIGRLKKKYKEKLQGMLPELPPSDPEQCTSMVVYRPHATVGSQYHPRNGWTAESGVRFPSNHCSSSGCRPATDPRTLAAPLTAESLSKGYYRLMSRAHHAQSESPHHPRGERVANPESWLLSDRFSSLGSKDRFHLQAQPAFADSPRIPKHSEYLENWADLPDDLKVGRDPSW